MSVQLSSYLQFSTKSIADLYETVHLCNLARAFAACICNTNNLVGTVLVFFLSSGHLCLIFLFIFSLQLRTAKAFTSLCNLTRAFAACIYDTNEPI